MFEKMCVNQYTYEKADQRYQNGQFHVENVHLVLENCRICIFSDSASIGDPTNSIVIL